LPAKRKDVNGYKYSNLSKDDEDDKFLMLGA
jgi:hypothetical protein